MRSRQDDVHALEQRRAIGAAAACSTEQGPAVAGGDHDDDAELASAITPEQRAQVLMLLAQRRNAGARSAAAAAAAAMANSSIAPLSPAGAARGTDGSAEDDAHAKASYLEGMLALKLMGAVVRSGTDEDDIVEPPLATAGITDSTRLHAHKSVVPAALTRPDSLSRSCRLSHRAGAVRRQDQPHHGLPCAASLHLPEPTLRRRCFLGRPTHGV